MQVNLKDVGAQNVPTHRLLLNLPRRKVMIYFCQKLKQMGGCQRLRFGDSMARKIPEI